jgi:DNA primase
MTNTYHTETAQRKPGILGVIGQRVELRKRGRQYQGLCPFHQERTPSFMVNEDKGVFYCHSCHVGGDVIKFVELIEQTDFRGRLENPRD